MAASPIQDQPFAEPTLNRHALTGRSVAIDPRVQAVRADLTDIRLCDRVFAPHYAAPVARTALAITPLRSGPDADAAPLSQLLPGDRFDVLELSETLAWGISATDGVVGYVDAAALGDFASATHRITGKAAALHEAPDRNATVLATLPLGARIAALGERGAFLLTDHGYVALSDVAPLNLRASDRIADTARSLIGITAMPGGRSGAGVDAAGLLFLTLDLCGLPCPRFLDLQREALGSPVEAPWRPSDLLFFAGKVAIAFDSENAAHVAEQSVTAESIATIIERDGPIVSARRIA